MSIRENEGHSLGIEVMKDCICKFHKPECDCEIDADLDVEISGLWNDIALIGLIAACGMLVIFLR